MVAEVSWTRETDVHSIIANEQAKWNQLLVSKEIDCFHFISRNCSGKDNTKMSIQYIPRNMHTVFALRCFVVVIHWLIFPYPSGLLHWHCGNLTIAPVPAKQPWWIWINTSCEFIMNDCITTTKQSTRKPCSYSLGYTVSHAWCQDFVELNTNMVSPYLRWRFRDKDLHCYRNNSCVY